MEEHEMSGCSQDACESCTGCGEGIKKISLRVEWRHIGDSEDKTSEITTTIHALSAELAVSGVELTFINNTFSPEITQGTSEFLINRHPLDGLVSLPSDGTVSRELLRKGIFQALLQNI